MRKYIGSLFLLCVAGSISAAPVPTSPQDDFERSIEAVVRNKQFYKAGHLEISGLLGGLPYDSVQTTYLAGGRLTWHIADHFGWEVADVFAAFPSTTTWTTSLVQAKGISNLEAARLHLIAASNLIISPLYGKMRLWGARIAHFDIYLALGVGAANTDTIQESSPGSGQAGVESVVRTGFDPMFDAGVGFKLYLTDAFALVADIRDYVTDTQVYGNKSLHSNFTVLFGLSFFLPPFG